MFRCDSELQEHSEQLWSCLYWYSTFFAKAHYRPYQGDLSVQIEITKESYFRYLKALDKLNQAGFYLHSIRADIEFRAPEYEDEVYVIAYFECANESGKLLFKAMFDQKVF